MPIHFNNLVYIRLKLQFCIFLDGPAPKVNLVDVLSGNTTKFNTLSIMDKIRRKKQCKACRRCEVLMCTMPSVAYSLMGKNSIVRITVP